MPARNICEARPTVNMKKSDWSMDRVELDLSMTISACWKSNHPLALEDQNRGGGNSRGKGNEQYRLGLTAPVEEDAQLAIEALGFTLREIGWARL